MLQKMDMNNPRNLLKVLDVILLAKEQKQASADPKSKKANVLLAYFDMEHHKVFLITKIELDDEHDDILLMGYECNRYQEHWLEINLEDYLDTSNHLMLIQYLNTDSTVEKEERYFKKHFFK